MPRGGARPGAGRPPGSHGETAKLIQQAADDGVLPLKVMLDSLRLYAKELNAVIGLLVTQGAPQLEKAEGDDNPHSDIIEAIKQVLGIRKRMEEVAAMAAPYCHPRQGPAVDEPANGEFMPLAERIAAYTRAADLAAAGGNVVELPR